MPSLYQDMNGTLFILEQYENCTHQDVVFPIDKQLYKLICNCGHRDGNGSDVREVLKCSDDYPWNPSGSITLVEHIREYFYAGHDSIHYRVLNKEIVEKSLFL